MGFRTPAFKSVVAAFLTAWLSAPLAAQSDAQSDPAGDAQPEAPTEAPPAPSDREADLLAQLREAEDPHAASLIETEIKALWSRSGSPAIDLLLKRGQDALAAGTPDLAIDHFTAAIDHAPDFAEAYAGRAAAFYLTGRVGPAVDDLRQALVLNPNHYEALRGFAILLEEMGRPEDALEVWHRVNDMHPQNAEAQASVDRLELTLGGRTL